MGETKKTDYTFDCWNGEYYIICKTLDKCSKWTKVDLEIFQYSLNGSTVTQILKETLFEYAEEIEIDLKLDQYTSY